MVNITQVVYQFIQVNGLIIKNMVRVNFIIMMDLFIEVNGNLVNKMDMDNLKIKMVRLLKEIGLMEKLLNEK